LRKSEEYFKRRCEMVVTYIVCGSEGCDRIAKFSEAISEDSGWVYEPLGQGRAHIRCPEHAGEKRPPRWLVVVEPWDGERELFGPFFVKERAQDFAREIGMCSDAKSVRVRAWSRVFGHKVPVTAWAAKVKPPREL